MGSLSGIFSTTRKSSQLFSGMIPHHVIVLLFAVKGRLNTLDRLALFRISLWKVTFNVISALRITEIISVTDKLNP